MLFRYAPIFLSFFRKLKTYFLYNNNSILIDSDKTDFCFLDSNIFTNISRNNKKTFSQTLKELITTTLIITFIFAILVIGFYLYDNYYLKNVNSKSGKSASLFDRDKYANL